MGRWFEGGGAVLGWVACIHCTGHASPGVRASRTSPTTHLRVQQGNGRDQRITFLVKDFRC